jgi:PIN domain associated with the TPR-GreAB-C-PIN system
LLAREHAPYVTDAATLTELVLLNCESALAVLPEVYVSSATQELLDSLLEEEREGKATGYVQDIDGVMGYMDITEADRARRIARQQSIVDVARRYCQATPVYGPGRLPRGLETAEHVLERDEYEALLLAAEKNATLITLDGRLAMLALQALGTKPVSVQALLMHAETKGALEPAAHSYACVLQFLANRTFVSLRERDLVTMCLQGGRVLDRGLQRLKDYLANPNTNFESGARVALEFLELQPRQFTRVAALSELLSHIVEALLRHPACVQAELLPRVSMFLQLLTERALVPDSPYPLADLHIEARRQGYYELFANALQEAVNMAARPSSKRTIRLKVLACTRIPMLVYDRSRLGGEDIPSERELVGSTSIDGASVSM